MANYAVLGLGLMGTAIVHDLLTFDSSCKVYGFDNNSKQRQNLEEIFESLSDRLFIKNLDLKISEVSENHPLVKIFKDNNIITVFGAIDYKFNVFLTNICIHSGSNFLDLGGNPDIVKDQRKLNKNAQQANITVIPDCGLAPGMANVIAAHGMNQFDTLESCHMRVGGLPQTPKTILNFQRVFSIRGLTNEYLEDAIVIRNGEIKTVPSLTETETLTFPDPWGQLEAFQTSGGTSSLPELYKGKIDELTYKTIRFPGHGQFFRFLKELGVLSSDSYPKNENVNPRELIEYYLERYLPYNESDAVLVSITIIGTKAGKREKVQYKLIDLADPSTGFSAMARTTSFSTSIIGQMVTRGIINQKGVVSHESVVPEKEFKDALIKRNIVFTEIYS
ncbi:MAG: Lysine 6-dehydrogenase [Candidatus Heimdallarchaeota archaeon LC_3]|nr:MAG: Lysine 6-dehydrogenase [Candidatus Heimdallarchaeota archaeon LC_3]